MTEETTDEDMNTWDKFHKLRAASPFFDYGIIRKRYISVSTLLSIMHKVLTDPENKFVRINGDFEVEWDYDIGCGAKEFYDLCEEALKGDGDYVHEWNSILVVEERDFMNPKEPVVYLEGKHPQEEKETDDDITHDKEVM